MAVPETYVDAVRIALQVVNVTAVVRLLRLSAADCENWDTTENVSVSKYSITYSRSRFVYLIRTRS